MQVHSLFAQTFLHSLQDRKNCFCVKYQKQVELQAMKGLLV